MNTCLDTKLNRYIAQFVNDDAQVIDSIANDDHRVLLAKSIVMLEKKYPDALCRIQDTIKNRTVNELKVRHYYE
ncbi:MAG: hypothetical protein P1U40_11085 [Coxiellaceae bacterium]|nr:hypothetical protein [Coxiellaceae bacterium]